MMKSRLMFTKLSLILVGLCGTALVVAQNPIVPNKGLNDPHIHIFNDTAYVYASHDKTAKNTGFTMEDWWVWSSPDLVNWTERSILKPKDTYLGEGFNQCWATDVGRKNGKYYWYFSEGNKQTGVVVGDTPVGPWKDPLGKPMLTEDLTPTHEYDMAIFEEAGEHYIIFGVWDYYIAKLNEDMISLAEKPRKIVINNPRGPYNPDGKNKEMPTDDKPFLHKYKDRYYLSWGCFYATAKNLYGPYDYKGTVLNKESFAEGYDAPTWPNGFLQGRHGSFFEWHNQWYFAYCDISQTGNRWFRDTFISYVHYKENGEMAPIRVDGIGVGQYTALQGKIEAEDYFNTNGFTKVENANGGFSIQNLINDAWVQYPNVNGLSKFRYINLKVLTSGSGSFNIEIRRGDPTGELLAVTKVDGQPSSQKDISMKLSKHSDQENLVILVKGNNGLAVTIDSFFFSTAQETH